ncbi:hypothetical protein QCA50_009085 [Cerrena zonata]|uniref:Uncharacterized protein n=1 Tax=Cerrena zonata TaxID=2478898 RepID=A0AAW0G4Q9_9APHY
MFLNPARLSPKDRAQISRPILAGITALPPCAERIQIPTLSFQMDMKSFSLCLSSVDDTIPGLFEHPLLDNILEKSFNNPEVPLFENRHLWALEGIMPGAFQSMDPSEWRPTRGSMLFDSIADSKRHFSDRWGEMQKTRMELEKQLLLTQDDPDGEGEMEVDELFEESASMAGS